MMMSKRPNILFAIADDASHFGCYGNDFVKTPACDWIAQNGVRLNNAFTTNPKCAPSRAGILTGKYSWELEDAGNHFGIFPSKFPVFPDLLERSGYHVGYTGKGWGPGSWQRGGFTRNPAGNEYNNKKLTPPSGSRIRDIDYAANFCDFLAERDADEPFYFWYGSHEPHRPYNFGEGGNAGKSSSDINYVPSYWPNEELVKTDMSDYAYEIEWFDNHLSRMIEKLREIGELENTLIIATSDNGMPFPRVKGHMFEQDFHLPMTVCWKNAIPAGRCVDDLISFADIAPTFLEAAGLTPDASMTGRSILKALKSDKDGRVDAAREYVFMGRERHDVGRENDWGFPVRCIRDYKYLYSRNFKPERWPSGNPETNFTEADNSPTKSRIIELNETGESKYFDLCFGKRPAEELYDIIDDVECVNNLAYDERFTEIKERLRKQLEAFLTETKDPRMFGRGDEFDTYEHVGNFSRSWKAYVQAQNVKN